MGFRHGGCPSHCWCERGPRASAPTSRRDSHDVFCRNRRLFGMVQPLCARRRRRPCPRSHRRGPVAPVGGDALRRERLRRHTPASDATLGRRYLAEAAGRRSALAPQRGACRTDPCGACRGAGHNPAGVEGHSRQGWRRTGSRACRADTALEHRQAKGRITRLKRSMYGRAGFDLLRRRLRLAA